MAFSSIIFLFYFLAAVLLVYYIVPKKAKNAVLFAASLLFCAWDSLIYAAILLFSVAFNYASGLIIGKNRKKWQLAINITVNIVLLVCLRYLNLLSDIPAAPFGAISYTGSTLAYLAISFYTLRALSYTIDLCRGTTAIQHSFINFGLYLSMFPLTPAGPVVRYNDVARQLINRRSTGTLFLDGASRFSAGLCKKVIIADSLRPLWTLISGYDLTGLSASYAWLGIITYALWIYFAFSGYSDMALGLSKMFGFKFDENFRYPYAAKSIGMFGNRWNISLSAWFKEYIYFPELWWLSIPVLWSLIGLWHGGSINFILWGLYLGVFIVLEKLFLKKILKKTGFIANIYTLFVVTIGWLLFAFPDLSDAMTYLGAMFNGYNGWGEQDFMYNLTSYLPTLIIAAVIASGLPKRLCDWLISEKAELIKYISALIGFLICVAYILSGVVQ